MPLYDFRCEQGHVFERQVKLSAYEEPQYCSCQSPARRVISTPRFSVENVGYDCPITGKWIGSKREHQDNLSRHNCRVLETGETQINEQRKADAEAKFEKQLDDGVEKLFDSMPSEKKERLANEVLSGMDIAVERGTV